MILYALIQDGSKDDIAYYAVPSGYNVQFLDNVWKKKEGLTSEFKQDIVLKSKFTLEARDRAILDLKRDEMYDLFIK